VDDPLTVRPREGVGDLDADAQRLIERQRSFREPLLERLAVEPLHDQKVDASCRPTS